jgi:small conductance mechanosensitive channel
MDLTSLDGDFAEQAAVASKLADALGDFAVNLFIAALILLITLWASGWAAMLVRRALTRFSKTREDRTLQGFGASVVRVGVLIIGGIAVLTRLGVETTSIIAVVGAASLAIGLALQGALGNVASGVMLLVLRPYQVGDVVEIAGKQGVVTSLRLFTTEIDTPDHVRVVAPNGKVFGDVIVNFTAHAQRRVDLAFPVGLDDLDVGMEALRQAGEAHERVLRTPAPSVEVTEVGDGRARLTLHAWVKRDDYIPVKSELFVHVRRALADAGVHAAYPGQIAIPPKSHA